MCETVQSNSLSVCDETLAALAKCGDNVALTQLIQRYTPLIRMRARYYTRGSIDVDDLYQEGMIALLKAVRGYHIEYENTFKTFAFTCVNNKLRNAIIAHMRLKNAPMLDYIPLDNVFFGGDSSVLGTQSDPAQMLICSEETENRNRQIETLLSPFEQQVLKLYLSSFSYEEMADKLGSTAKAVDNALQRVRRKLRSVYTDE